MRRFVDMKEMPNRSDSKEQSVTDGPTSVSEGKVITKCLMFGREAIYEVSYSPNAKAIPGVVQTYPFCVKHGALIKNGKAGIWRCPECHEGAWEID